MDVLNEMLIDDIKRRRRRLARKRASHMTAAMDALSRLDLPTAMRERDEAEVASRMSEVLLERKSHLRPKKRTNRRRST